MKTIKQLTMLHLIVKRIFKVLLHSETRETWINLSRNIQLLFRSTFIFSEKYLINWIYVYYKKIKLTIIELEELKVIELSYCKV